MLLQHSQKHAANGQKSRRISRHRGRRKQMARFRHFRLELLEDRRLLSVSQFDPTGQAEEMWQGSDFFDPAIFELAEVRASSLV
ncbi:MAG: hypothetical protein R3C56_15270 [Pirellulaceae bacterium]